MNFELPIRATEKLLANFEAAGFHPSVQGQPPIGQVGDIRGSVALTFIHQDPDLRRDVPAFG